MTEECSPYLARPLRSEKQARRDSMADKYMYQIGSGKPVFEIGYCIDIARRKARLLSNGIEWQYEVAANWDATIEYTYLKGSRDYYDKALGCWLPGDEPEVEVLSVTLDLCDKQTLCLPEELWEPLVDDIITHILENHNES